MLFPINQPGKEHLKFPGMKKIPWLKGWNYNSHSPSWKSMNFHEINWMSGNLGMIPSNSHPIPIQFPSNGGHPMVGYEWLWYSHGIQLRFPTEIPNVGDDMPMSNVSWTHQSTVTINHQPISTPSTIIHLDIRVPHCIPLPSGNLT